MYGEAVLREMLRSAPPVPFVYREALQDLDVGGYKVPKVPASPRLTPFGTLFL